MSADTIFAFFVGLSGALGAWAVGYATGKKRGRDQQWVDDFIDRCRADRERRDRAGRFRKLQQSTQTTNGDHPVQN